MKLPLGAVHTAVECHVITLNRVILELDTAIILAMNRHGIDAAREIRQVTQQLRLGLLTLEDML